MSDIPPFDEHPLSPVEVRVLGSLIEKQATTPESYPLTLNALQLACNQKTSREPLMNLDSGPIGAALRQLENRQLVRLVMGSRADRWEQRLDKALGLTPPQLCLLGLLLLRGPQTVNELLTRSQRLHAFEDGEELLHQLQRLIGHQWVMQVARQGGQREDRYMHLLGDAEERAERIAALGSGATANAEARGALEERLSLLEARLADVEARLASLTGA